MFQRNIFLISIVLMMLSLALYYLYPSYVKSSTVTEYDIEGADFFWTGAEGKSYNIKADYVMKVAKDRYRLTNVYCRYYLSGDKKDYLELSASNAFFNEEKNLIDLKGNVECKSSAGYQAITGFLHFNLNEKIAQTEDKISITSAQGTTISEKGMKIYMGTKKILLHGPITSTFISTNFISVDAAANKRGMQKSVPIGVKSNSMEIDYNTHIITYQNKVMVHQAQVFDLYCDAAQVFYTPQNALLKAGKLTKYGIDHIKFFDNIMVVKDSKIAVGDFGVFDTKTIILKGNVALKEKEAYLQGEEVHYNTKTGVFTVHKAKPMYKESNKENRIRVILGNEKGR